MHSQGGLLTIFIIIHCIFLQSYLSDAIPGNIMNLNVSMIKKNVRVNILIVMMVVDQKMLIVNILKFKKAAKKYLDANPVPVKQRQLIAFTILAQRFISISKGSFRISFLINF